MSIKYKIAALFLFTISILNAATLHEQDNIFTLKNKFISIQVDANNGGRIKSLKSAKGQEYCYWNQNSNGFSGLLDDKGIFTNMSFVGKVALQTPNEVALELTSSQKSEAGLRIIKTIILEEDQSFFKVIYKYLNTSDNNYCDLLMQRNYLLPGSSASNDIQYRIPLSDGIEIINYPYGDLQKDFKNIVSNWMSVINKKQKTGVTLSVVKSDFDFYFYALMARENPPVETVYDISIPPKKFRKVHQVFTLTSSLNDIIAINQAVAIGASKKITRSKLTVDFSVEVLREVIEQIDEHQLEFCLKKYNSDGSNVIIQKRNINLDAPMWTGDVSRFTSKFKLPGRGLYVLSGKWCSKNHPQLPFEFPIYFGKSNLKYLKGKGAIKNTKSIVIKSTPEEKERGYIIHGGITQSGKRKPVPELHLASNEQESFKIVIHPLKNLGVSKLVSRSKISAQIRIKGLISKSRDKILFNTRTQSMDANQDYEYWITVDAKKIPFGMDKLHFEFIPQYGPATQISIPVKKYHVEVNPKLGKLTMWYLYSELLQNLGEKSFYDLHQMDVNELRVNFGKKFWNNKVKIVIDSNQNISIDFSKLKACFKLPLSLGMRDLTIMYNLTNKHWLGQVVSPDIWEEKIKPNVLKQLSEFLSSVGFKDIEYFWTDEPPTTVGKKEALQLKKLKRYMPNVRIAMTVNHMTHKMISELKDAVDVWYMSTFTADEMIKLYRDSSEDIRIYFAWARIYNASYSDVRSRAWYASYYNLDCYGIYNYFKPSIRPDRIVFSMKRELLFSPARLAVVDGHEDFLLMKQLEYYQRSLPNNKNGNKLRTKLSDFRKLAFSSDFIGLQRKYRYGHDFMSMPLTDDTIFRKLKKICLPLLEECQRQMKGLL